MFLIGHRHILDGILILNKVDVWLHSHEYEQSRLTSISVWEMYGPMLMLVIPRICEELLAIEADVFCYEWELKLHMVSNIFLFYGIGSIPCSTYAFSPATA
ncbi:hypothetical protein VNO77_15147 [Canavalia gladiata]|uniref:Uncharacterized protein n=1 Tax=Canavalia gladiata TaxID=3824 RepID=A0AAN9QR33_CANGL